MAKTNFVEKRAYLRFPVAMPVSFRETNSNKISETKTYNICSIGLCIQTNQEIPVGASVDVCINVKDNSGDIYRRGTVIWVQNLNHNHYRIGIRFEPNLNPIPLVLRTIMAQKGY